MHLYLNTPDTCINIPHWVTLTTGPARFTRYLVSPKTVITYSLNCISMLTNSLQASGQTWQRFKFKPNRMIKDQFSPFLNYSRFFFCQDKFPTRVAPAVSLTPLRPGFLVMFFNNKNITGSPKPKTLDTFSLSLCCDKHHFFSLCCPPRWDCWPNDAPVFFSFPITKPFP